MITSHAKAVAVTLLTIFVVFTVCLEIALGEQGSCNIGLIEESQAKSRQKRFLYPIDLEHVRRAVIAPESISNHVTSALTINSLLIAGYLVVGLAYNFAVQTFDLPVGDVVLRNMDIFFAPTSVAQIVSQILRNFIFGVGGRILFNILTNPDDTQIEFSTLTFRELTLPIFSDTFITIWLGRIWLQTLFVTSGLAFFYFLSDPTRSSSIDLGPLFFFHSTRQE